MKKIYLDNLKSLLFAASIFLVTIVANAQTQKGFDIDGEAAADGSGFAVSMPDTNTIAIGAPGNGGAGNSAGHVRVFNWNNTAWVQKGADIDGEQASDQFGKSVIMPDANTLAIGAPSWRGGNKLGYVKVYRWNGISWVQRGAKINGDATNTLTGWSVSMPDSNTLALSAPFRDGSGFQDNGRVRVYYWNGTGWVQKGADIWGQSTAESSGYSISMPNANTLSIGAPDNSENATATGKVRIFYWNNSNWIQKGTDIDGDKYFDLSGSSVSMPDSNTIAIGGEGNGGIARVFIWNGTRWLKLGGNINVGNRVSMPNSNTIAIGLPADSGYVKIYSWTGTTWKKVGLDIIGEAAGDRSGYSVCMPHAKILAVGAVDNDGKATNAGHVRVYNITPCKTTTNTLSKSACYNYISPSGKYSWNISGTYNDTIPNSTGCDSIITLILTINNVDVTVTNIGPTLSAKATNANYQWLDCKNDFKLISGAINQIFTVTSNGSYAVKVTQNGCTDTSACITVNSVGILENSFGNALKVLPNPTEGDISIDLGTKYTDVTVIVRNNLGQETYKKSFSNTNTIHLNIPGDIGFYTLEVLALNKKALIKVIKK
ncbi:MAG: T9SS type A sorting domain-containing protein [Bacteroidia bacterium]|nr:T9SS type A sorting domain-containing protein [Bacteroidia bacterium]